MIQDTLLISIKRVNRYVFRTSNDSSILHQKTGYRIGSPIDFVGLNNRINEIEKGGEKGGEENKEEEEEKKTIPYIIQGVPRCKVSHNNLSCSSCHNVFSIKAQC